MKKIADHILNHLKIRPKRIKNTMMIFVLLNGFWLIASHWIFVLRPYLNYDYLLAIVLVPYSVVASFIILLLVYVLELAINNALIFHFENAAEFLRSGKFITDLNIFEFLKIEDIVLLISFSVVGIFSLRYLKNKTNPMAVIIVFIVAFAADQLNGSSYLIKSDSQVVPGNISGSSALNIYLSFNQLSGTRTPPRPLDAREILLSKDELLRWYGAHPERSILFVIVESFGLNDAVAANNWIYDQLISSEIEDSYIVDFGQTPFSGATTVSELRHLCALKGSYNSMLTRDNTINCIPRAFAERGYPVVGSHGFTENMFLRKTWWKTIGLSERLFIGAFDDMGAPYCGSGMYGICDDFVIRYLGRRIEKQRGFYYHLTLNTHVPIVKTEIPRALGEICSNKKITKAACTLNAKVGEYLRSLSAVLSGLPEKPLVFVVGDHAPPFASKASRTFSGLETPYFILRPKS